MRRGVWVLAALVVLALPVPAHAAFPGQNGKIAFASNRDDPNVSGCHPTCNFEIYVMNPDGTGVTRLTNTPGTWEGEVAWSPDGTKIAFVRYSYSPPTGDKDIWVMDADGSDQINLTGGGERAFDDEYPAWSPDGTKIAFTTLESDWGLYLMDSDGTDIEPLVWPEYPIPNQSNWSPNGELIAYKSTDFDPHIVVVRTDGTGATSLPHASGTSDVDPNWSPDGTTLVFASDREASLHLYTMNGDGSNQTEVSNDLLQWAVWSPDGSKFAAESMQPSGNIVTLNSDGSGLTNLTNDAASDREPDWQPIPINSYARPKGATPFYGSLAIAYEPCTAPDRTHGPPLAYGSCSSPQMTSDYLTVGTADANGKPPRNEGYLRMGVIPGTPGGVDDADVALEFFSDDVFTKAIADYTGELRARVMLQITDKDNTPNPGGPGAATTTEIPLELTVGCTPVADPLEGSSCTATTSADALAPGTVKEGRRSIWQLGRVEVYDGGADGDAQTPAGDTLFATQGLFVP
jgi:TolB protein